MSRITPSARRTIPDLAQTGKTLDHIDNRIKPTIKDQSHLIVTPLHQQGAKATKIMYYRRTLLRFLRGISRVSVRPRDVTIATPFSTACLTLRKLLLVVHLVVASEGKGPRLEIEGDVLIIDWIRALRRGIRTRPFPSFEAQLSPCAIIVLLKNRALVQGNHLLFKTFISCSKHSSLVQNNHPLFNNRLSYSKCLHRRPQSTQKPRTKATTHPQTATHNQAAAGHPTFLNRTPWLWNSFCRATWLRPRHPKRQPKLRPLGRPRNLCPGQTQRGEGGDTGPRRLQVSYRVSSSSLV